MNGTVRYQRLIRLYCVASLFLFSAKLSAGPIQIESEGWKLHGDLLQPQSQPPVAFALLLHKVAGDRTAYEGLARSLADAGIVSLRMDLRGHGQSTNLGAFNPDISRYMDRSDGAVVANFDLVRAGDRDIKAAINWLEIQRDYAELPLVVVGSSYTGEEMVEAASDSHYADIYVALAPGSFSNASIKQIDPSGVPWLFVRAEIELPFFPALFDAIREGSQNAEIWVLPGKGHATDLLQENPDLSDRLVKWILMKLPNSG